MTKAQLTRKLKQAGIALTAAIEIDRDEITVAAGYTQHENNGNAYGTCDETATAQLAHAIAAATGLVESYYTGYGAIVLEPVARDNGDYNDKTSKWHY